MGIVFRVFPFLPWLIPSVHSVRPSLTYVTLTDQLTLRNYLL